MKKFEKPYPFSLLYVEDEELIRKNAVEFLSDEFENIYQAEDGDEALTIYREKKPDIIITDIEMPKMNGLNLCKKIRESDDKTPIIITTAFTDQKYLLQAIELNLVKYLAKPIDPDALDEALRLCVGKLINKQNSIVRLTDEHYFDTLNTALFQNREFIKLTAREKDLLTLLIDQKNRIVSYREIETYVWDGEYMSEDALKSLVKNLRKKTSKQSIQNHSKLGFKIKFYDG